MKMYKNIRFAVVAITVVLITAGIFFVSVGSGKRTVNLGVKPGDDFHGEFMIKDASIKNFVGGGISSELRAETIVQRKKTTRLFTYHNLKELDLSEVTLNLFSKSEDSEGFFSPKDLLGPDLFFFSNSLKTTDELENEVMDSDSSILVRININDITIRLHLLDSEKFSILAENAVISAASDGVLFHGSVDITSADGERLNSSVAYWSGGSEGIIFPDGYTRNDNYKKGKAFFKLSRTGRLVKMDDVPQVDDVNLADDLIKGKEDELLASLTKDMPLSARFMLGLF